MSQRAKAVTTCNAVRRLMLTDEERRILAHERFWPSDLRLLADLFQPFEQAFRQYTARGYAASYHQHNLSRARPFCALLMLTFDCTYWGFDWECLLTWKQATLVREGARSKSWRYILEGDWSLVTATLFFLGVLPYNEAIYSRERRGLANQWLGKERAQEIAEHFMQT